jgi:tetrahydromethanopterin S-methyltransferase subunit B
MMLAALCGTFLLFTDANAQRRARGRTYTKDQVNNIIKRVETRSDDFVGALDKALDNSKLDGTDREDDLNKQAKRLESTIDDLRREFDRKESYYETKPEVAKILAIANDINNTMQRRKLGGKAESMWAALRYDLNTLAGVYNLPGVR